MIALFKTGTKSVLFGAHCWFIHPFFVADAWRRLYGCPTDPRLWAAFFVHDLGYWGRANMDDAEGERHVEWGARKMSQWFDKGLCPLLIVSDERWCREYLALGEWGKFCLYHSRFYAKKHSVSPSRLCVADKLAVVLEPWWLYLPRAWASGELWEYTALARGRNNSKYAGEPNSKYVSMQLETGTVRGWHRAMTAYLRDWVEEHKDGRTDNWTPEPSAVQGER